MRSGPSSLSLTADLVVLNEDATPPPTEGRPLVRRWIILPTVCAGERRTIERNVAPSKTPTQNDPLHTSAFTVVGMTFSTPPAFFPTEAERRGLTSAQVL